MTAEIIYHYKKDRKQHAKIFINMGVACLIYIAGVFGYESFFNEELSDDFKIVFISAFSAASVILFYVAYWFRTHPATYEVVITSERFNIVYPQSRLWSFEVNLADIKRFEYRNTLSHAGTGNAKCGVLLKDGGFHEISVNYGSNVNKMYLAIKQLYPDVTFPKTVNMKVEGPLSKPYNN